MVMRSTLEKRKTPPQSFGQLLKYFRNRTRIPNSGRTLSQQFFADRIAVRLGIDSIAGATISYWENDRHGIHKDDRELLVSIITVLYEYDGLSTLIEADQLLVGGNYRRLNLDEACRITPLWADCSDPKS